MNPTRALEFDVRSFNLRANRAPEKSPIGSCTSCLVEDLRNWLKVKRRIRAQELDADNTVACFRVDSQQSRIPERLLFFLLYYTCPKAAVILVSARLGERERGTA